MTETNINNVVENLISLQPLLYKNFLKPARSKTHLPPGALFVMGTLKRNGILSMSEIGRKLTMPKPHVTGLIDKLIVEEYVERIYDPADRRIINIKITKKGIENLQSIKKDISEDLREKLLSLDVQKLDTLLVATQHVKEILTELHETTKSCCNE
jgi:DNA-binding MarR family transcriptional regulator